MGMVIGDNFDYKGKKPLDARMLFNTIADMKNFNENYLPDITLAFNKADGKMYMFNRSNDVDDTTGKWREFEGGESIQVETLPTASENVGKVYQYIGADTQNYKHDFFYESKYVEGEQEEYQRVAVDVQEGNYDTLKNKPVFVHSPSQQLYGWTAEYETGGETETYDFLTLIAELPENGNISVYDAEAEEWYDLEMIDGLAYGEDTVTRNSSIDQDITVIKKEINEKYYDIIGMTELPTPSNEYVNKVYKHVGDTVQINTPGGTVVDVYNQDLVTCQRINNSYYWTKYSMSTMLSYLPKYWMGGYGEANNYYHDTNKTIVSYNGALYIGTVDWNTFQWTWTEISVNNGTLVDLEDTNITNPTNGDVLTYNETNNKRENKEVEADNHWANKTWYAYGTSMTDTTMNGYTVELQSLLGANLTNYGKGGSGIIPSLHGGTSGDNTYTRVKNTTDGKTNADLITLEIIPNDMSGTLGTPTDNYADGTTETFCGCLNELLQYLQVNTNAQIVVLIATRSRYNYQDTTEKYPPESQKATDWLQWTDAAKECCRRNCVPFIDGQSNCGLGYARVSGDNKYVQDQIHLTTLGAKNLGQYFYSQIKNIPLFYSA